MTTTSSSQPTLYDMLHNKLTHGNYFNIMALNAVHIARQCGLSVPIKIWEGLNIDMSDDMLAGLTVDEATVDMIVNKALQLADDIMKFVSSVDGQFAGLLSAVMQNGINNADGKTVLRYCAAVSGALLGQLTAESFDMRPLVNRVDYKSPCGQLAVLCAYINIIVAESDWFVGKFSINLAKYSPFSPYNMLGMLSSSGVYGSGSNVCTSMLHCDMLSVVLLSILANENKF